MPQVLQSNALMHPRDTATESMRHATDAGKLVTVEPVGGVASPKLRMLLLAVMYQQHRVASAAKAAAGGAEAALPVLTEASTMLQLVLAARHHLRPIIQSGNAGCYGRWGERCAPSGLCS